jgi:hypothetical protein
MNIDYESEERIYGFLKSIFRYKRMIEKNAPDELCVLEKVILRDKLDALSPEEVFLAVTSWEEYYEKAVVDEGIQDEQTVRDINSFMQTLN